MQALRKKNQILFEPFVEVSLSDRRVEGGLCEPQAADCARHWQGWPAQHLRHRCDSPKGKSICVTTVLRGACCTPLLKQSLRGTRHKKLSGWKSQGLLDPVIAGKECVRLHMYERKPNEKHVQPPEILPQLMRRSVRQPMLREVSGCTCVGWRPLDRQ